MRGRKQGCPINVKDWQIDIHHPFEDRWVRILGLNSITLSKDSTTEDGSDTESLYEEPYVRKRSASLSLEGRVIVDEYTGDRDEGQALLNEYAEMFRCDGDAIIRMADAYGHVAEAVYIVTQSEVTSGSDGDEVSWDLEMVGEADPLPYKILQGISLLAAGISEGTLVIDIADAPRLVTIVFDPEDASNRRYKVKVSGRLARANGFMDGFFLVSALKPGTGALTVLSINGTAQAVLPIRITDDASVEKSALIGQCVIGTMVIGRSMVA